jgi:von Willebrand factor type A domain-containing protein
MTARYAKMNGKNNFSNLTARVTALLLSLPLLGAAATPALITPAYAQGGSVCGPMDVAIALDDTGSMGGAIDSIKTELSNITQQAQNASGGDLRMGFVTFKDDVTVHNPLTENITAVEASINSSSAGGGAGGPEASDEAKNTTVNNLGPRTGQNGNFSEPWRNGTVNILILITDAPPAGFDDALDPEDVARMHEVAEQANSSGIKVSDVFVPTAGDYAGQAAMLQDDANTTGGAFITTHPNGTGTAEAIKEVIEACGEVPPDNNPPDCNTATASETTLWPPNHRMKELTISNVTDPDTNDTVSVNITGVTQDEPTTGGGSGDKQPDAELVGNDTVRVRAERAGTEDGRVYYVMFEATDGKGGTCEGIVVLPTVPHDQAPGNTPIDSRPPEYDSLTGAQLP